MTTTTWTIKHKGGDYTITKNKERYMRIDNDITAEVCDRMHELPVYAVIAEFIRAGAPNLWTKEIDNDETDE